MGGASGQWVALGKDRQMEIRFREIWQPSVYQALLRMGRVPIVLGMAETENKAMKNEKKDLNHLPKINETYAHTIAYTIAFTVTLFRTAKSRNLNVHQLMNG